MTYEISTKANTIVQSVGILPSTAAEDSWTMVMAEWELRHRSRARSLECLSDWRAEEEAADFLIN